MRGAMEFFRDMFAEERFVSETRSAVWAHDLGGYRVKLFAPNLVFFQHIIVVSGVLH